MKKLLVALVLLFSISLLAEPWVSNRYAQNCAGCHAPGRLNLPPKDRRCTLSCQGCHVNPNGGGLRNKYGMWNQQRWLSSFKNKKWLGHKDIPKIHSKQPYMKTKRKKGKYAIKHYATTKKVAVNEYKYGNKFYKDWHKDAKNKRHFISRVPYGDPYREEREFKSYLGGDLRILYVSKDENQYLFPMALDLGSRIRLLREKLSGVVEVRFSTGPSKSDPDELFTSRSQVRSAYLLADDLIYNSYVQAGLFRPMFGNDNPDHYSLANQVTGLDQNAVFKGLSFGTAPNVPFGIITAIQPMGDSSFSQDTGFVLNLGGRFVTYSASVLLSYWSTESPVPLTALTNKKEMTAITAGGMYGKHILNVEFLMFSFNEVIDSAPQLNKGSMYTFEYKYRFWRENYAVANYAFNNTAANHEKGESTQFMAGVKSYLYPGTEVELLAVQNKNTNRIVSSRSYDANHIQLQLHLSF